MLSKFVDLRSCCYIRTIHLNAPESAVSRSKNSHFLRRVSEEGLSPQTPRTLLVRQTGNELYEHGGAKNAGPENAGPMISSLRDQNVVLENAGLKMGDRKMQNQKCRGRN